MESSSGTVPTGLWYHLVVAAIAAVSIVAFAVLPAYLAGVVGLIAILSVSVVERIVHRSVDMRPRGAVAVAYFIVGALVYFASLLLTVTVAKNPGTSWLAWVLGGLVFLVILLAAWVPNSSRR